MQSTESIPADRVILSSRTFEYSRELVFRAWSDPKLLATWWGPKGFTNTFYEFDQQPGGRWKFTMHGPDGHNYENDSIFREIVPDARIVFDHVCNPLFRMVATFDGPAESCTLLTWRMIFETAEVCAAVKSRVGDANEENFDRLEAVLAKMKTEIATAPSALPTLAERELTLSREIDATPAEVFTMWTEHFSEWWGPHGMTTPFVEMDLRPGGVFRTVMRAPDGTEYPTKGVFLDVIENEKIVFTDAFGPGWEPAVDLFFTAITTFEPLPGGKTRYTARALHWTVANREAHEKMGFHQGWGESLDRLVACVAKSKV